MTAPRWLPDDWFPAPLPANVVIGDRTWLYSSYAFLHYRSEQACGVRVGHDSGLYIGTFFDLGPEGSVDIGSYCTLNGVTFATNSRVSVGDYVLVAREVVISDTPAAVPAPSEPSVPELPVPVGSSQPEITIANDAWIGTRATLLPGARIGTGAIVGAAAVIDFAVPPYAIAAGNPARIVGWSPPAPLR